MINAELSMPTELPLKKAILDYGSRLLFFLATVVLTPIVLFLVYILYALYVTVKNDIRESLYILGISILLLLISYLKGKKNLKNNEFRWDRSSLVAVGLFSGFLLIALGLSEHDVLFVTIGYILTLPAIFTFVFTDFCWGLDKPYIRYVSIFSAMTGLFLLLPIIALGLLSRIIGIDDIDINA